MQNLIDQYNTFTDATMLVPVMALGIASGGGDAKKTTATLTVAASAAAKIGAAKEAIATKAENVIAETATKIYRWGNFTNNNLTPKADDIEGLSFKLKPPATGNYLETTLEKINNSGILKAIKDGTNHTSVFPNEIEKMTEWINSKPNAEIAPHEFTELLKTLIDNVVKNKR